MLIPADLLFVLCTVSKGTWRTISNKKRNTVSPCHETDFLLVVFFVSLLNFCLNSPLVMKCTYYTLHPDPSSPLLPLCQIHDVAMLCWSYFRCNIDKKHFLWRLFIPIYYDQQLVNLVNKRLEVGQPIKQIQFIGTLVMNRSIYVYISGSFIYL